jgi:hypothetical protein
VNTQFQAALVDVKEQISNYRYNQFSFGRPECDILFYQQSNSFYLQNAYSSLDGINGTCLELSTILHRYTLSYQQTKLSGIKSVVRCLGYIKNDLSFNNSACYHYFLIVLPEASELSENSALFDCDLDISRFTTLKDAFVIDPTYGFVGTYIDSNYVISKSFANKFAFKFPVDLELLYGEATPVFVDSKSQIWSLANFGKNNGLRLITRAKAPDEIKSISIPISEPDLWKPRFANQSLILEFIGNLYKKTQCMKFLTGEAPKIRYICR